MTAKFVDPKEPGEEGKETSSETTASETAGDEAAATEE